MATLQYGNMALDDPATQRGLTHAHALRLRPVYFAGSGIVPMA